MVNLCLFNKLLLNGDSKYNIHYFTQSKNYAFANLTTFSGWTFSGAPLNYIQLLNILLVIAFSSLYRARHKVGNLIARSFK